MEPADLIGCWGLISHPFTTVDATDEENLPAVFLEPPYFGDILGDPLHPKSAIVHGDRGDGKSAAREMIAASLGNIRRLIINYNRFSHISCEQAREAKLDIHLEAIAFAIL